jgi:3-oxoacyl-[acyl-carrier protein] reductase
MEFENKTVMITGAGSGIGRATAIEFASLGAKVAVCDINIEKAKSTVDTISGDHMGEAKAFLLDVSDSGSVRKTINDIISYYGRLDILVNVAGIIFLGRIEDVTDEAWDRVLDVNLKGTFLCCREATPVFKKQRSGCIVNISAAAAKTGGMNVGANYVASKAGISVLTIHLARQLAPYRIRVNAVSPGPIDTPMLTGDSGGGDYDEAKRKSIETATPLGLGLPEDVAKAIVFLASEDQARYITGEILDVNGGLFMD